MKILIMSQLPTDACTFYRALQPLRNLRRTKDIHFTVSREISPNKLLEFDVVYMIRPALPDHYTIAEMAKGLGVKLWVDYDDDLFSIPYDHEAWGMFSTDTVKKTIARICQMADVVTVSTDYLKTRFDALCQIDSYVMPNFIDDKLYSEPTKPNGEVSRVICWRGGDTHRKDLECFRESFIILARRYNYRFFFMGMKPIPLREHLPIAYYSHLGKTDYVNGLYRNLKHINAPVHVVPLYDCPLNRGKSNLAMLEATWFGGSAVVGPAWWHEAINTASQEEFVKAVVDLMESKEKRLLAYDAALKAIKFEYSTAKNEQHLREIFKRL